MFRSTRRLLSAFRDINRGRSFASRYKVQGGGASDTCATPPSSNPLEEYFDSNTIGPGLWKWRHYFDPYHRHLRRYVGKPVHVVEIGIFSGGSLGMWRKYFGAESMIYGIDIEPACLQYEAEGVKVVIGDQADRGFWTAFRRETPIVDVLIDDGGHSPDQQMVTLEEMLPHIRPGGVFICEDVHGFHNGFGNFMAGMQQGLNAAKWTGNSTSLTVPFQDDIESIHLYPFMTVIEKTPAPVVHYESQRRGTQWQPFL